MATRVRTLPSHEEKVLVTPQLAKKWLDTCPFPYQRVKRDHNSEHLAAEMAGGRWANSPVKFGDFDRRTFLLDGQHRLHALIHGDLEMEMLVITVCCETWEDVVREYQGTDAGMVRKFGDAIAAAGILETHGLHRSYGDWLGGAMTVLLDGFQTASGNSKHNENLSRPMRAQMVARIGAEGAAYVRAIAGRNRSLTNALKAAPTVAVAILTFQADAEKAHEFWNKVSQMDGLRKGTPEHTLVDFFLNNTKNSTGNAVWARRIAVAWNAFREGRSLQEIRLPDMNRPMRVSGHGVFNGKSHKRIRPDGGVEVLSKPTVTQKAQTEGSGLRLVA